MGRHKREKAARTKSKVRKVPDLPERFVTMSPTGISIKDPEGVELIKLGEIDRDVSPFDGRTVH